MYYCCADDTQVYVTLKPCGKWGDVSSSIETCIEHVGIWMNRNMLKLDILNSSFRHASNMYRKLRIFALR